MPSVTIFTTMFCPYCVGAKQLLKKKNVPFVEVSVDGKPEERAKLRDRTGGSSTVPQIFIGDHHIGGCDELYALEGAGKLDSLLAT